MNVKILAAIALIAASGSAAAVEQNFPSVEVNAKAPFALAFSCNNISAPSPAETTRILNITDQAQTPALRSKLTSAVGEACVAGARNIVVQRGANGGSVTWSRSSAMSSSIALN
jgi:hypothetical protein